MRELDSWATRDLLGGPGLIFEERDVHELKGHPARVRFALVRYAASQPI